MQQTVIHAKRRGPLAALLALPATLLAACTSPPSGVEPVTGFEVERYAGRWYEIKRLDHRFERGATRVTAEYQLRDDGKVSVVNRAFDARRCRWQSIEGSAEFQGSPDVASLNVTFFWPITGGYHVIELDHEHYQWAMVAGPNRGYLWILAREPQLDAEITEHLVARAEALGFAVDELIDVDHSPPPECD